MLKLATVDACVYLGQVHPSYALTRLKHLATHGSRQIRDEVLTVAVQLAGDDDKRALICAEAVTWASHSVMESSSARQLAGAELFLRLAGHRDRRGHPSVLDAIRPWDTLAGRDDESSRVVYEDLAEGMRAPQRAQVPNLVRKICDWTIRVLRL